MSVVVFLCVCVCGFCILRIGHSKHSCVCVFLSELLSTNAHSHTHRGSEHMEAGLLSSIPIPTEALFPGLSPPVSSESIDYSSGVDSPLHMSGDIANASVYNPMGGWSASRIRCGGNFGVGIFEVIHVFKVYVYNHCARL